MITNPQLELARKFVEFTNMHVFLTGKAGTGKTTFLLNLKRQSPKRCVVVAPTGVAAINAGGVTIHSFFQIPFGPHLPEEAVNERLAPVAATGYTKISRTKMNIIRSLDLLIIDEISMVRADLLDGIDEVLRRCRRTTKPFGGVQLLMIGDVHQLSPVVKEEDRQLLGPYYNTFYFFGSRALQKTNYISIELSHIYRQSDRIFIDLLNRIRENRIDKKGLERMNQRYIPGFKYGEKEDYILLTTHNYKANKINRNKLDKLKTGSFLFRAEISGEFPDYIYPTDVELELKEGAQVMFIKNDPSPEKRFYNGKIGIIDKIDPEEEVVYVKCTEDHDYISVCRTEWQNCRYSLNTETKAIEEKVIGGFVQLPLKLAWAITIHKSQGLTFDKAIIDAHDSFAHCQVYVALSRCRTLEGLVLSTPITLSGIKTDSGVYRFAKDIEENHPDENDLRNARDAFQRELLFELFDFNILQKLLLVCGKVAGEHKNSLLIDLTPVFQSMQVKVKNEMMAVAEKFHAQLSSLLDGKHHKENNRLLQERLCKAADYFGGKLDGIFFGEFDDLVIETDNKQTKKQIEEVIEKLFAVVQVKKACLDSCRKGFQLKEFLDARSKALIEKINMPKKQPAEKNNLMKEIAHPELYARLRQWRNLLALEQHVPVYRVISQQALAGIASEIPVSMQDMLAIKGIGRKKIATYGSRILEIIADYCSANKIKYKPDFDPVIEDKKTRKPKHDTRRISLEMFREGKKVEKIADERGFVVSTIHGHLAHYVEKGELEISEFLSQDQLKEITEAVRKTDNVRLTSLKEALKHKYDYGELKMAMAYKRSLSGKE